MNVFDLSAKIALDINGYLSGMDTAKSVAISTMSVIGSQVSGFINNSVEVGKGFSSSMSQVAATMGNTMDEMGAEVGSVDTQFGHFDGTMRDFAKFMGKNTAFSAKQASDALNYMALAGYDTQKSMETLPNVLNLAAAGNMDLAKASDMVTDAQTALGLTQDRTTQMMNEMAKAASSGNTNVEQLGDAFLTVGGLAKNLNGGMVTLADGTQKEIDGVTELEIALTAMANAGIKGSEAGTHMRNMLLKLSSPTDEGAKRMEELGVKVFDAQGNMRSLKDVMGDLNIALGRVTQEEKLQAISDLFNARDISSAEALLAAVGQDWDYLGEQILNADGAMEQMAETQLDNLQGDITKMNSAMEGLQIAISDAATPAMRELTQMSTNLISSITSSFSDLPEPLQTTIAMIGMVGGKAAEFAPQAFGMINSLKQTADLARLAGDSTGGLAGKLLSLGPTFGIVSVALAGVTAVFMAFRSQVDENTEAMRNFKAEADSISDGVDSATESVQELGEKEFTVADAASNLAKAQANLEAVQRASADASKKTAEGVEAWNNALYEHVPGVREAAEQGDKWGAVMASLQNGLWNNTVAIQSFREEGEMLIDGTDELTDAEKRANEALIEAQNQVAAYTLLASDMTVGEQEAAEAFVNSMSATQNSAESYQNMIDMITELNTADQEFIASQEEVIASTQEQMAALDELLLQTKESVGGALESVFGNFDMVEVKVEKSVGDMISAMDSQLEYMASYSENMKWLTEQGVDEGLIAKLSDGSMESMQILQALRDDGGAQLKEFSDKFAQVEEGKGTFVDAMAKLVIDYDDKMTELQKIQDEAMNNLNTAEEAYNAAVNTMRGAIKGADEEGGVLIDKYESIAREAIRVFRQTLKINSPSKVFEALGAGTMEGAILGAEEEGKKLLKTYGDLATSAIDAYDSNISSVDVPDINGGWRTTAGTIAAQIPRSDARETPQKPVLVLDGQIIGQLLTPYITAEIQRVGVNLAGGMG